MSCPEGDLTCLEDRIQQLEAIVSKLDNKERYVFQNIPLDTWDQVMDGFEGGSQDMIYVVPSIGIPLRGTVALVDIGGKVAIRATDPGGWLYDQIAGSPQIISRRGLTAQTQLTQLSSQKDWWAAFLTENRDYIVESMAETTGMTPTYAGTEDSISGYYFRSGHHAFTDIFSTKALAHVPEDRRGDYLESMIPLLERAVEHYLESEMGSVGQSILEQSLQQYLTYAPIDTWAHTLKDHPRFDQLLTQIMQPDADGENSAGNWIVGLLNSPIMAELLSNPSIHAQLNQMGTGAAESYLMAITEALVQSPQLGTLLLSPEIQELVAQNIVNALAISDRREQMTTQLVQALLGNDATTELDGGEFELKRFLFRRAEDEAEITAFEAAINSAVDGRLAAYGLVEPDQDSGMSGRMNPE